MSASLGGCASCKELEHYLETEHKARRNAAMKAVEAQKRCLDLAVARNKIENNLYQAIEKLRRIEGYIETATEDNLETERKARRNTAMNAAEAQERCVDLAAALNKIGNNLYQATEELRRIECYIKAATEESQVEWSNVRDVITID